MRAADRDGASGPGDSRLQRRGYVLVALAPVLVLPTALSVVGPLGDLRPRGSCVAAVRATPSGLVCGRVGGRPARGTEVLFMGRRLDLNRADAAALQLVPGIGPRLAARVVTDRAERGPFCRVGAAQRVKGIGPKLVTRLADYFEVRLRCPSSSGRP